MSCSQHQLQRAGVPINFKATVHMQRVIIWWDELDDVTHAARHLVAAVVAEIVHSLMSGLKGCLM